MVRRQPVVDPILVWWRSHGPVTVVRHSDTAEVVRHRVSEEDEHVRRYMAALEGRFFRDLAGAMILRWFLLFGCIPPAPIPIVR